jgi:nucleoporin POM34
MIDETIYEDALSKSFTYSQHQTVTKLDRNDFVVPLKRLGNMTPFVNNNTIKDEPPQPLTTTKDDLQSDVTLKQIDFKLHQSKLAQEIAKRSIQEDHDMNRKEPVYYKPPVFTMKYIQSALSTPSVSQSSVNKIPLTIPKPVKDTNSLLQLVNNDDMADMDEIQSHPTGEWINPIMKQALSRQINKQHELKKVLRNVVVLLVFALIKSFVNHYMLVLQKINSKKNQQISKIKISDNLVDLNTNIYTAVVITIFVSYMVISSIISLTKLMKEQDQCLDLPLSDEQRRLIGLKVERSAIEPINDTGKQINAELTLKQRQYELNHGVQNYMPPKYPKISAYAATDRVEEKLDIEKAIQLNASVDFVPKQIDAVSKTSQLLIPSHNNRDIDNEKKRFEADFGLSFNCKEDF